MSYPSKNMDKSHKHNVKHKNLEIKGYMIPCISSTKDAKLIYDIRSQGNNFYLRVGVLVIGRDTR